MALHGFSRKLNWRDFTEVSKSARRKFDASTFVNLGYKAHPHRNPDGTFSLAKVRVTIAFSHRHSWVVKGKQTDELLKHEQAHYDIAAIAGRTIEAKLSTLQAGTAEELTSEAKDIFEEIAGKSSADGRVLSEGVVGDVQARYDEDAVCGTDHSRNVANQATWLQRITKAFQTNTSDIASLDSCPRLSAPPAPGAGTPSE